jgi:plasmid stabilization system protein ParE
MAKECAHFLSVPNILFYREAPDGIELWRVIHGKRDIPRLLERYGEEEE